MPYKSIRKLGNKWPVKGENEGKNLHLEKSREELGCNGGTKAHGVTRESS
jgi:hypothetical protein